MNKIKLIIESLLRRYSEWRYRGQQSFANIAEGQHEGGYVTYFAGSLFTTRFCFVKRGSDSTQVIPCAATTDQPFGVAFDIPDAVLDPINIAVLGGSSSATLKIQSGPSYAAVMGDYIQTDSTGLGILWASGGYAVGRVVRDAPAGDIIEFTPLLSTVAHV